MLRVRQSSDGGFGAGAPAAGGGPNRPCMQSAPNSAAWRMPVHGAAGWGGRHRSSPTGGAANGMPLNDSTPSSITPCTSPLSIRTTAGVCAAAGVRGDATMPDSIAASPISAHTRKQVTLTAASVLSSRAARIVRHPCRSSFLQAFQVAESKLDPSLGGGCHVLLLVLCETLPDLPKVIGATCARRLDRALGSGEWLRCHHVLRKNGTGFRKIAQGRRDGDGYTLGRSR